MRGALMVRLSRLSNRYDLSSHVRQEHPASNQEGSMCFHEVQA